MAVRIIQIEKANRGTLILQIAGKLFIADAEILEQKFDELRKNGHRRIEIDLSEMSFLDSESATVLMGLQKRGAVLTAINFFIRKVIETVESRTTADENNC